MRKKTQKSKAICSSSTPINIVVSNNSSESKRVEILGAYNNITNKWFTEDGSLLIGGLSGVTIRGSLCSYDTLLAALLNNEIEIGGVHLHVISSNKLVKEELSGISVLELALVDSDIYGFRAVNPIYVANPEGAVQKDVYQCNKTFRIDGGTSIWFDIPQHTVFDIYFYPKNK